MWSVECLMLNAGCYEYLRGSRNTIATATHNVRAMG